MSRRRVGRPPAQWVHQLAKLDGLKNEYLDYHDLSKMFGLTLRSVQGFCAKASVKGEYYRHESNAVRKRFSILELKRAAQAYLKNSVTP